MRNGGGVVTRPCRGPHTGLYHRVPRKLLVTRFPFVSRKEKKRREISNIGHGRFILFLSRASSFSRNRSFFLFFHFLIQSRLGYFLFFFLINLIYTAQARKWQGYLIIDLPTDFFKGSRVGGRGRGCVGIESFPPTIEEDA